jgi:hypothetical protein
MNAYDDGIQKNYEVPYALQTKEETLQVSSCIKLQFHNNYF